VRQWGQDLAFEIRGMALRQGDPLAIERLGLVKLDPLTKIEV
jgi:hypothetical protein